MHNTTLFDYQKSVFEILNVSELGLVILDDNRQVIWCNGEFATWLHDEAENLTGKNWLSLPFEPTDDDDQLYCLVSKERNQPLHLQHWKALLPSNPKLTVHYFKVIHSENPQQKGSLKFTGLPKRPNWVQFLDYEVSRSRRYDNPLAVLKVKLVMFGDPDSVSLNNRMNQLMSEVLKDELRWADMIGHSHSGEYLLVLPETTVESSDALKQKIRKAIDKRMQRQFPEQEFDLVFGEAHWSKGDSSGLLLDRVRDDLLIQMQHLMEKYQ
ncbi:sensor domain-containing diguanylate cyclase [Pleionea mediterranea]|jgi:GGDEF domain-containing protein|uniref:GGDEF domain-containing protein n=1 Tax=Pleionea mediterranea TaxID=523701 RepID=A0A316FVN2_9GAMM|nr:PAS domain-containing protein [Pleionea mediterranea]PWK52791.1 GGDEF domain-containing protein [Pleionea mediterranea]